MSSPPEGINRDDNVAAQDRREVVIRAARLACATYPHTEAAPRSDIDYYMAQLRDELALLDKEREA